MTFFTSSKEFETVNTNEPGNNTLCLAVMPKHGLKNTHTISLPIYWLKTDDKTLEETADNIERTELGLALKEILLDTLQEELWCTEINCLHKWTKAFKEMGFAYMALRQYLPGVTDNLAHTVKEALVLKGLPEFVQVASGTLFLFNSQNSEEDIKEKNKYIFFHPITDKFVTYDLTKTYKGYLDFPSVYLPSPKAPQIVSLNVSDKELEDISKTRLLALNLEEMKAIKNYFQNAQVKAARELHKLPNEPLDIELEIIAQTWSEHCKHKIFNCDIVYKDLEKGHTSEINSLYKTYIKSPTYKLMENRTDLLSVFEDNAGIVRWNNEWAFCFKVETHNSPSALEPYGGALTGILGVNRDILGTGLGAKPIFNTDIFCFAYPSQNLPVHPKLLPAKTILDGVRKGVQDGGNKSGIATVNGAIYFHPGYRAKPLVFCGTGGILPITVHRKQGFAKHTQISDIIIMAGGRVGKDGIHGATFSSEALHEGSPNSAVQIGDPFTQKRLLDFVIEARDRGLISGITDNGAGGLSSSVGEMAQLTNGATIELDNVPTKYPGLADYEIVISESQERMTISTSAHNYHELKRLAERYNIEATAIGTFHSRGYFEITRNNKTIALLDLEFLHKGTPKLRLEAEWKKPNINDSLGPQNNDLDKQLLSLLAHHNICSRETIIRQYDHEVQGLSVIKPLMGPKQQAPCDAAVIQPLYEEDTCLAISNGLAPQLSEYDTYTMSIIAVDEAIRNAVCVGCDPKTITLLDNFCWPDPVYTPSNSDGKYKLAQLVRSCQGLEEAVLAFRTPLISGKDSMKNDFADGNLHLSIPPTLLISATGKIPHAQSAISMEFKSREDLIYLLKAGDLSFAGSQYASMNNWQTNHLPSLDLKLAAKLYAKFHEAILLQWVKSAHDVSDGGIACAIAECVIGSELGADINLDSMKNLPIERAYVSRHDFILFAEGPGHIIVTIARELQLEWEDFWREYSCTLIGTVNHSGILSFTSAETKTSTKIKISELFKAWQTPLPFD